MRLSRIQVKQEQRHIGVDENSMNIKLTEEDKIKLANSDDVYAIMQKILLRENNIDQEKEHLWIIGMSTSNKILFIELVSLGSVNATTVEPMNVFRVAVLKGAIKTILIHNHPSGELTPSATDKDITDRLIQVGRIINIDVIDHLIITPQSFLSFVDTGLFKKLCDSLKWVPAYELIEKIRKEEQKIREEAVKRAEDQGRAATEQVKKQALQEKAAEVRLKNKALRQEEKAQARERAAKEAEEEERWLKEQALLEKAALIQKLKDAGIEWKKDIKAFNEFPKGIEKLLSENLAKPGLFREISA